MTNIINHLEARLWQNNEPSKLKHALRIFLAVFRVVNKSRIKLFAASLTYYTLLAIVPLLALLFMLLKLFGVEKLLKQLTHELLAPMGKAGEQVGDHLFQFIGNAQAGLLGGIGLLFLFYSVYKLFNAIEKALNHLWLIETKRQLKQKILGYIGIIVLSMVVAAIVLGLNIMLHKDVLQNQWIDTSFLAGLLPFVIKCLSIFFTAVMLAVIYSGAINFNGNFKAFFLGGLFCALLWLPLTTGFAKLMSISTSYSVIYSGFTGLVVLLIWLNILWLLFLSGALVAYFVQFPSLLKRHTSLELNPTEMEYYARKLIGSIVESFSSGNGSVQLTALIKNSQLSHKQVLKLLQPFLSNSSIVAVGKSQNSYLLAVHPEMITSDEITATIRGDIRYV